MNFESNKKFRKILNDLKRRPEDAAKELGLSIDKVNKILKGEIAIDYPIIEKATSIWPVNHSDFFSIKDDTEDNIKIFKKEKSDQSARKMERGGVPYYLYKDTVMSKVSPFRPEWIQELVTVENSDPNNNQVRFNNGHFLHQFTYFIGPVNFYYMNQNENKQVEEMNTGDSMYISPYIPHSFTTRKNDKNTKGLILALTYTDKIDNDVLNELSAIGKDLAKKFKINITDKNKAIYNSILNYLKINSMTIEYLETKSKVTIKDSIDDFNNHNTKKILKIAEVLNLNIRDLLPPEKYQFVKIGKYSNANFWHLPSEKDKEIKIVELANVNQLPNSKALEISILKENQIIFDVPCHQYVYNVGNQTCEINFDGKIKNLEPEDSCYIKPNLKHSFKCKSKILVLRIAGKLSGENIFHLSILNDKKLDRLLDDNKPWFN